MKLKNKQFTSILISLLVLFSKVNATTLLPHDLPTPQPLYGPTQSAIKIVFSVSSIILPLIIGIIVAFKTKLSKKVKRIIIISLAVLAVLLWNLVTVLFNYAAKPIIYLYPENQTEVTVTLGYPEKITCSYPEYNSNTGWNVIANPDGTLIEIHTNKKLYSLYWEGKNKYTHMQNEGFVVKGENVAEFLEEKLAILGLNYREAEEFIIYWLPKMQENNYNYIRFATPEEINEYMPLNFSIEPDSLIRVYMEFKPLTHYIDIPEQKLTTPKREGFVVVEWGGTEMK